MNRAYHGGLTMHNIAKTDSQSEAVVFPVAPSAGSVPPPQHFCHAAAIIEKVDPDPWLDPVDRHADRPPVKGAGAWSPAERARAAELQGLMAAEPATEWALDFEHAYHEAMEEHARRWASREGAYAEARARALFADPFERMAQCGRRSVLIGCACERRFVRIPVGCGLRWLCPDCRETYYRRTKKRLKRAMRRAESRGRSAWAKDGAKPGARPDWVLVTLTVRHSGDLATDRERIVRGWKRTRQWLWQRIGRFPYALTWEVTSGRDGKGHVHAHVACLWPAFDWRSLRFEWLRAMEGESARIDFQRAKKRAGGCAAYLSKYASKGVEIGKMPPRLAARAIAATYNRRILTTSHHFWVPRRKTCTTCCEPWKVLDRPAALAVKAPFLVWRAREERFGVGSRRGPPQKVLFPTGGGRPGCPSGPSTHTA